MPVTISRRKFLAGASALAGIGVASTLLQKPPKLKWRQTAANKVKSLVFGPNKKLNVLFQFGEHATAGSADRLGAALEKFKPHVVCLENGFGTEKEAKELENSFYSPKKVLAVIGDEFSMHEMVQLAKHGKPRIYVPERFNESDSKAGKWLQGTSSMYYELGQLAFRCGDYKKAIAHYRDGLDRATEASEKRENHLQGVISNLHSRIVKRFPELKNEKEIRVLFRYGTAHTSLYGHARKRNFGQVQKDIPSPVYFDANAVAHRAASFGHSHRYTDTEVARALISDILFQHAANQCSVNHSNSSAFANLFSKKLTMDQIKRISTRLASSPEVSESMALKEAFRQEKITLPMSKQEIHGFLERRIGTRRLAGESY